MTAWKTTEPPINEIIEYETDLGERLTGALLQYGADGRAPAGHRPQKLNPLFMSAEKRDKLFRVLRWRDLDPKPHA
jgi:hypothetical protein